MGNICSGRVQTGFAESPIKQEDPNTLNSKLDLRFNASMFVQENSKSFLEVYNLHEKPLGSGAYGEVWLCNHSITNELRAVKILLKEGIPEEEIQNRSVFLEVEILKKLDHPNILKVFEYFEDDLKYYIVMEYCNGGDLFDKLGKMGRFSESLAAKVMSQLLSSLNYLHGMKIIHRDIKPENLLIADMPSLDEIHVKLIDFNIATVKKAKLDTQGTLDYMAPEVFKGNYDEKCDVWGAGIILYALLCGNLPFKGASDEEIEKSILKAKPVMDKGIWNSVTKECKDFIMRLLDKNPTNRLTANQALNHPWVMRHTDRNFDQSTFKSTLRRIATLSHSSKLKEAITTFMISQLSNHSSTKKLQQVFNKIDHNKDGVITLNELTEGLKSEMSAEEAETEAKRVMSLVDVDGSGHINYTEFLRVSIEEESLLSKDNLKKTFSYFDKDGSGSIEKQELITWLSAGGCISDDIIQQLIDEADTNGDGSIDIIEFEELLFKKLDLGDPSSPFEEDKE